MFDAALLAAPMPPKPPTPSPNPTPDPEDILAGINFVWWFGRISDGKVWAINALTGRYFHVASPHNGAVFAQWLGKSGIPFEGSVGKPETIAGDVAQFGVEMVQPATAS
jgi:hypothetical protein